MEYHIPDYYRTFSCIGSECPDTCCGGWQIPIDRRSLARYRALIAAGGGKGFGRRLKRSVDFRRRTFRQTRRRCRLLTPDGLCSLYIHAGPGALCRACRVYPRHQEEFGSVREISLSLSCPEAARILLTWPRRPRIHIVQSRRSCPPGQAVDPVLLDRLFRLRETMLKQLWPARETEAEDSGSLESAVCEILDLAAGFQASLENRGLSGSPAPAIPAPAVSAPQAGRRARAVLHRGLLQVFSHMEPVEALWPELMRRCRALPPHGLPPVSASPDRLEERQLLTYFLSLYLPGAVYDRQALANIQMAVCSWQMTARLAACLARLAGYPSGAGFPDRREADCIKKCAPGRTLAPSAVAVRQHLPHARVRILSGAFFCTIGNEISYRTKKAPGACAASDASPRTLPAVFWIQAAYLYSRQIENSDFNLNRLVSACGRFRSLSPQALCRALSADLPAD